MSRRSTGPGRCVPAGSPWSFSDKLAGKAGGRAECNVYLTACGHLRCCCCAPLSRCEIVYRSVQESTALQKLYHKLGPCMVSELQGDFAFVLHDPNMVQTTDRYRLLLLHAQPLPAHLTAVCFGAKEGWDACPESEHAAAALIQAALMCRGRCLQHALLDALRTSAMAARQMAASQWRGPRRACPGWARGCPG